MIQKSTIFRKSVRVIDTLTRVLREGDRLDIDITQHFNKGINLNTLYGIENEDLPASAFLIVETFGDRRGKVIDRNNGLNYNGYSPVKIRYDFKLEIGFTCAERDTDRPIVIRSEEKDKDFDSMELGEDFYPTREEKFNVNYDDIKIGTGDLKGRYELMLEGESEPMTNLESLTNMQLNSVMKNVLSEEDVALNITETDDDGLTTTIRDRLLSILREGAMEYNKDFESKHGGNRREDVFENEDMMS